MSAEQPPYNPYNMAQAPAPPPYDEKSSPYPGNQQQPQHFVHQPQQFVQQPQQFVQQPQQVTVQVNTINPVYFGHQSTMAQCPACQYTGYTKIDGVASGLAWVLCAAMGVFG